MFSIIKTKLNYLELSRRKEILLMTDRNFMRVEDVARELDVSKSYAYKIVQKLNKELAEKGQECTLEEVLRDIEERDRNDREREIAPCVPAEDAVMFDNSELDFDGTVEEALRIIREKTE